MAVRDRVQKAVEGPTLEAARLLNELQHGSTEERLTILIDGWCRGLAGALEELAISIDDLERSRDEPTETVRAAVQLGADADHEPTIDEAAREEPEPPADEQQLAERAQQSRDATAALKQESSEATSREPSKPDRA
jgi:hypothetical protein